MPSRNVIRSTALLLGLAWLALAVAPAAAHCPHNGRLDHPHCSGGGGGGGNIAPTADPGGPYAGVAGQPVQLDGSGSVDPDGPTRKLRYAWTFGDGATSAAVSPGHTYAAAGVYPVTLTVTDAKGAESTASTTATITLNVAVQAVATGLASPVHLTAPPGDATRLFIVERAGRIRLLRNGTLTTFLDMTGDVAPSGSNVGLFSLAFHPQYASNGAFFVYFTNTTSQLELRRYVVSANPDVADAGSKTTVLTVPRPAGDHFGGLVTFGPDGRLLLALGDGGSGGITTTNAQDLTTLLGKLIRLDVDAATPYAIPGDNPFAGSTDPALRQEIWGWGLRNPWRFSVDRATGELSIADVGQNRREEVNVAPAAAAGLNYGWPIMEGSLCFDPAEHCDPAGLTLPVFEYDQADGGCSITGGHVYRGTASPGLAGVYFYSDFCAGWLRSFRLVGGQPTDVRDWDVGGLGYVVSFGEDAAGEVYVLSFNGTVYRIVATD
jgi:glucose/arabinose dehydrogenase